MFQGGRKLRITSCRASDLLKVTGSVTPRNVSYPTAQMFFLSVNLICKIGTRGTSRRVVGETRECLRALEAWRYLYLPFAEPRTQGALNTCCGLDAEERQGWEGATVKPQSL